MIGTTFGHLRDSERGTWKAAAFLDLPAPFHGDLPNPPTEDHDCGMPRKAFTKAEGYSSRLLLHYGRDHLRSARILFERSPACYDSAGFLTHLGIELFLKASLQIMRHQFSELEIWLISLPPVR